MEHSFFFFLAGAGEGGLVVRREWIRTNRRGQPEKGEGEVLRQKKKREVKGRTERIFKYDKDFTPEYYAQ